jgi:hypothetical protein
VRKGAIEIHEIDDDDDDDDLSLPPHKVSAPNIKSKRKTAVVEVLDSTTTDLVYSIDSSSSFVKASDPIGNGTSKASKQISATSELDKILSQFDADDGDDDSSDDVSVQEDKDITQDIMKPMELKDDTPVWSELSNKSVRKQSPPKKLFNDDTSLSIDLDLDSSPLKRTTSREATDIKRRKTENNQHSIQKEKNEDGVLICEHNVLLSSPEQNDEMESESAARSRLVGKCRSDTPLNFANESSSSIGQIEISEKVLKPLIPLNHLNSGPRDYTVPLTQMTSKNGTIGSRAPSKEDENAITMTNKGTSNAFLHKLQTNEQVTRNRLEVLRKELEETQAKNADNEVGRKKMTDLMQKKPTSPAGPLMRSYSDPINHSFTNDSIVVDDDDYEENDEKSGVNIDILAPPVAVARPAIRTQTLDSARSRKSKEERELMKQQKEKEKQSKKLYNELNKSTRTKEELLGEMIINIPRKIKDLFEEAKLSLTAEMRPIQVKPVISGFGLKANLITWERKSNSKYIKQLDCFEPVEFHLIKERQSSLVFHVDDFIKIIEEDNEIDVIKKFKDTLTTTKDGQEGYMNMIILIIGLDSFVSKIKNIENREYTKRVRENMQTSDTQAPAAPSSAAAPASQPSKRKTKAKDPITKLSISEIEGIISKLRVHGMKIFPTKNVHETMTWLKSFTYTISGARYDKYERNQDLANIGVIKSGVNKQDTFEKMLMQFKRMNSLKASKIIRHFGTLKELSEFLNSGNTLKDYLGGELEVQVTRFFKTLDENHILKD